MEVHRVLTLMANHVVCHVCVSGVFQGTLGTALCASTSTSVLWEHICVMLKPTALIHLRPSNVPATLVSSEMGECAKVSLGTFNSHTLTANFVFQQFYEFFVHEDASRKYPFTFRNGLKYAIDCEEDNLIFG